MAKNETADTPSDVQRGYIWPRWGRNQAWRDKVQEQMIRKSLDIPENDMQVHQSTKNGMGWKELAVIGALVGGAGYAGKTLATSSATATSTPAAVAPAEPSGKASGTIRFFTEDGATIGEQPVK